VIDAKQPPTASPVAPRLTPVASSAFSQLGTCNAKIGKEERIRSKENEKLHKFQDEKTAIRRVVAKSRVTKSQTTRVSKAKLLVSANPTPQPNRERTPDYAYSVSTAYPPNNVAPKPTTSQIYEAASETMISGQVDSIQKKRKAEEGLEGSNAKTAKQNKRPLSEHRHADPKRAAAHAQHLTNHEEIFGKGSKPRVGPVNLGL